MLQPMTCRQLLCAPPPGDNSSMNTTLLPQLPLPPLAWVVGEEAETMKAHRDTDINNKSSSSSRQQTAA